MFAREIVLEEKVVFHLQVFPHTDGIHLSDSHLFYLLEFLQKADTIRVDNEGKVFPVECSLS